MAKKYKLTGCARFFIFLLIIGPLVYFGVSYFRGENPVEPVKELIKETTEKVKEKTKDLGSGTSEVKEEDILDGVIDAQKTRIQEQKERIETLENQVKQLEEQLRREQAKNAPATNNVDN